MAFRAVGAVSYLKRILFQNEVVGEGSRAEVGCTVPLILKKRICLGLQVERIHLGTISELKSSLYRE